MELSPEVFPITPEVERIGQAVAQAGGRPVLVGGWVRDCQLGIPHSKDFDIEVFSLSTRKLQEALKRFGSLHTVGRHFGVLKLITRQAEYDVSVPRRESKIGMGHKDFHVVADPNMSFEEAASRRDFTINSMGYAFLEGTLLDPFDGSSDLRARILRHTGPAFGEDPLRVLRAIQFSARFGMIIAEPTLALSREQDLSALPRERIWGEFRKLLLSAPEPAHGLRYAEALGVLPYFPELARLVACPASALGQAPPWDRTLAVVNRAAAHRTGDTHADLVLMSAALTHLLGCTEAEATGATPTLPTAAAQLAAAAEKPARDFLARMTRENGFADAVVALIRDLYTPDWLYGSTDSKVAAVTGNNSSLGSGTGSATSNQVASNQTTNALKDGDIRRLALRVNIPLLLRLARAHWKAGRTDADYPAGDWLLERAQALDVFGQPPEPLLKGRHLLALGQRPGPHLGPLLREAFERQLDGELESLEDSLAWVRRAILALEEPGQPKEQGAGAS